MDFLFFLVTLSTFFLISFSIWLITISMYLLGFEKLVHGFMGSPLGDLFLNYQKLEEAGKRISHFSLI